jgi:diguanylate cyclase (GGDEF)-like protein
MHLHSGTRTVPVFLCATPYNPERARVCSPGPFTRCHAFVNPLRAALADLQRALREPPDEVMLEIGAGGEILLARLRLVVAIFLLLLPIVNHLDGGPMYETFVALTGIGLVLILSQVWLGLARHRRRHRWLPFVSAAFDVSLVSLVLWLLALESPAAGLNSMVAWSCYSIAIIATVLRNDTRVTLLAGSLAVLQFTALSVWYLVVSGAPLASPVYGLVEAGTQVQRALLLVAFTVVSGVIVFRMQRLVALSGTDGLTGIPNRTYLRHRVPRLVEEARADGRTLCLALLDLDHFKRVNEELGHLAGDRALRHVVDALRLQLTRDEPMMRVGGEEFVIVMRQPLGAAWERLDMLRRRLQATPFLHEAGAAPRTLTISAGIACCPQDATDVSGLLGRADERLRAAKQAGRNRVVARDM